jgi:hypothetical protein
MVKHITLETEDIKPSEGIISRRRRRRRKKRGRKKKVCVVHRYTSDTAKVK